MLDSVICKHNVLRTPFYPPVNKHAKHKTRSPNLSSTLLHPHPKGYRVLYPLPSPPVHEHAELRVEALAHQQLEKLLLQPTLVHALLADKLDLRSFQRVVKSTRGQRLHAAGVRRAVCGCDGKMVAKMTAAILLADELDLRGHVIRF